MSFSYERSSWSGPRVFAISSGKGGVGKTTLTANLAYALAEEGQRVLIFDGDLGLANVDVLFGLTPHRHIGDVLAGRCSLKDIIVEGPKGVRILPASSGVAKLTRLSEGEKIQLLQEFEELALGLDWVLLDTPAGISENVLYFNLASQERILVCTPEPTSLTDVYALIKVLYHRYGVKNFHLVVNWVRRGDQALEIYRQLLRVIERFLGSISLNFLGGIPFDKQVSQAVRAQQPLLSLFPESLASKAIYRVAREMNRLHGRPFEGGLQFFGRKLMGVCA